MKEKGYLWKCYGFTKTHLWGLHIVSSLFAIVGVGMLTIAILGINELSDKLFYRMIAASGVVMLVNIGMILYSMFMILFYKNCRDLAKSEEKT